MDVIPVAVCGRCGTRPLSAFHRNHRLLGGHYPWCNRCLPEARRSKRERDRYKADYQRAYAKERWRRTYQPRRPSIQHNRFLVTRIRRTSHVRIEGAYEELEAGRKILIDGFGVDPADIEEHGRGGGSGRRRQKTIALEVDVSERRWQAWLTSLS